MQVWRSLPAGLAVSAAAVALATCIRTTFWLPAAVALVEVAAAAIWIGTRRWRVFILNSILVGSMLVAGEAYLLWCDLPMSAGAEPPLRDWFRLREGNKSEVFYYPTVPWRPDEVIGWSEKPSASIRERRYVAGRLISAATYSTDEFGFRKVPRAAAAETDVLLLGCSMTWGSNLNDDESYPWQLGELLGPRIQVHNFGLPGIGPNTILAMLQAGYLKKSLQNRPVAAAYYVAWLNRSVGHIARVLGRVPWSADSPRYRLSEPSGGRVVPEGRHPVTFDQQLQRQSMLTAQIGRGLARLRSNPTYLDSDVNLTAAIVAESDKILREQLRIPLTVILLRDRSAFDLERQFEERLKSDNVRILSLALQPAEYLPRDVHPSPAGARRLAQLVHDDLRQGQPSLGGG